MIINFPTYLLIDLVEESAPVTWARENVVHRREKPSRRSMGRKVPKRKYALGCFPSKQNISSKISLSAENISAGVTLTLPPTVIFLVEAMPAQCRESKEWGDDS